MDSQIYPCSAMDFTNMFTAASRLRRLMISHDKAVQQMFLLADRLRVMERQFGKMDDYTFPARKCHLFQRYCMIEWIHNAYDEYRLRKWVEIQMFINYIFSTFHSESIMDILLLANINARNLSVLADTDSSDESDSDPDESEDSPPRHRIYLPPLTRPRGVSDSSVPDDVFQHQVEMVERQVSAMAVRNPDALDSDYGTDSSDSDLTSDIRDEPITKL